MKMKWQNMTPMQKVSFIISCIAVAVWVVSKAKPGLFPIDPTYPAIAVFTVCEAVVCWNQRRKWSYLLIAGAVVSMACFLLELSLM